MLSEVQFEDIVQLYNYEEMNKFGDLGTRDEFLGISVLYVGASQNGFAMITDLDA